LPLLKFQPSYFRLFIVTSHNSDLNVLSPQHLSTQFSPQTRHMPYHGTSFSILLAEVLVLCY